MHIRFLTACAMISVLGAAAPARVPSQPAADLACKFRHSIAEVGSIEEVPRPIQMAILRRIDPVANQETNVEWQRFMAPRGAMYNSTDVVAGDFPSRRFIRAGHTSAEWFVWFERGGIAYAKNIALFHLRLGRGPPILRAFLSYRSEDPCAVTDDLLDGRPAAADLAPGWW